MVASKARMVPFAGWEMPVQFGGLKQEHEAVRTRAGVFDISHMGKVVLRGKGILAELEGLVPTDLSGLAIGQAQYSVLLNEKGGIIDDLIIYNQGVVAGQEQVRLIINASTCEKDVAWLRSHLSDAVALEDISASQVLLAVQGPKAVALLQGLTDVDLVSVPRFGHVMGAILETGLPDEAAMAFWARTGYTGEDGYEVMLPVAAGQWLWEKLLAVGAEPCGLGARDTLRLEAAMALYGQDITEETTPLEAGLGWLVHLDRKGDFVGRSVLEAQKTAGVSRRLVALEMAGRNIARHDYPVVAEGQVVGIVTSGTWSPTLEKAIALAYVPVGMSKLGSAVQVEIRGKACEGRVVKKPFYKI
jgi:aminomethyltransferase